MIIGLKIDVDTFSGTRDGVIPLCRLLEEKGTRGSFFFSVGPDNMGRHLWRLLKPAFLAKMLRSNAASLYGWDIILCGTVIPGPQIGKKLGHVIHEAAQSGHEIGLHAWDHHAWQSRLEQGGRAFAESELRKGVERLTEITGQCPTCSAAPAWKCDEDTLLAKEAFPFRYNSDCRGEGVFQPQVKGRPGQQPQIPSTLPTYDELIGRNGITHENYNQHLISLLNPDRPNVLTIHAEAEGRSCLPLFRQFVEKVQSMGARIVPLSDLLPPDPKNIPVGRIEAKTFPGREGWMAVQA
ncbi:MAG TPA: 4-deoxy-4-formamido-L-arabinose-phosphoundecaprenol deformylase [Verrucomicrobia bacterium]|nr:MAG: 4-deoxy-4-formamido-L-arabinose-phosphoundecaprenol deformylase [Lentisphaerae bacterium GWF2_57_35]HBA83410.1 4-deoxy-4-formamido-L-arabinose-phosphoundecaprenol deformylase [Verrucomicrobiota bacterium]